MKAISFLLALPLDTRRKGVLEIIKTLPEPGSFANGPTLWLEKETALIELAEHCRVIGILFAKNSASRIHCMPTQMANGTSTPQIADWLIKKCWGGYVAIFDDPQKKAHYLLVDPLGQCPVYRLQTSTHVLVASHPALLQQAYKQPLRVSWQKLRQHLRRPELRQRGTCLADVSELVPGALTDARDLTTVPRSLWEVSACLPERPFASGADAAETLRAISTNVIGAWSNALGSVAVAASGGVDSSLICAALNKAGIPFDAITLATADPSGDERQFVRALGSCLSVPVHDAIYNADDIDPEWAASAGLARPSRKTFMMALDAALMRASQAVGADVVLDGNGGDNLFCFLHSATPVADRLRCEGLGRGAVSSLIDMCRITSCDAPTMARAVFRRLRQKSGFAIWTADNRLLADCDDPEEFDPLLQWFDVDVGNHLGKREHLSLITRAQNNLHGLAANGLPRFSPLLSQPLVEYCLTVPTWIWCDGGFNRAPARQAFADILPPAIIMRTSKAGPDSFIGKFFDRHRAFWKELLLDGTLSRHGLIDREATEQAFAVPVNTPDSIINRLLDLVEAENWARSWEQ